MFQIVLLLPVELANLKIYQYMKLGRVMGFGDTQKITFVLTSPFLALVHTLK